MRANEFVTEEPRVAAHRPEILSATDDGKTITIKVRTHDGSVRVLANSNPAVLQQWLNVKYGLRLPHSIARKFVGMPAAMVEDQADNPDSWESQAADAERDAETAKMAAQDAAAGGLAEQELDEDLSRRGFLKGAGAAAVAGAAGSAMAAPFKHTTDKDQMTGEKTADVSTVKSNDGKAILELRRGAKPMVVLEVPGTTFNAGRLGTNCRYKIGNGPVIETLLAKPSSGASDWGAILPSYQGGEGLAEKIMRHLGEVLFEVDLYKTGAKVFKFTIEQDATSKSVNEQGVAEGELNEKSTSQAQFRTMAAAAHNPKFAKKVGISPDVAREFHGADKKSNYKSLPKKAAEDASWGMAPEGRGYKK